MDVKAVYEAEKKYGAAKDTCKWAKFGVKTSVTWNWKGFNVTKWTKAAKKGEEQDDLELWAVSDADHFGDVELDFVGPQYHEFHTIYKGEYCVQFSGKKLENAIEQKAINV